MKSLDMIFALCGMPNYIHSDIGPSFISCELKRHLSGRGIATSKSTPYHPIGNGQVERYNGIIWRIIKVALRTNNLPIQQWEKVLPDTLHSIWSLLSTATNITPHDRFFNFPHHSSQGSSVPWLTPGSVFLHPFVRSNKNDDLVGEVELTDVNPTYSLS